MTTNISDYGSLFPALLGCSSSSRRNLLPMAAQCILGVKGKINVAPDSLFPVNNCFTKTRVTLQQCIGLPPPPPQYLSVFSSSALIRNLCFRFPDLRKFSVIIHLLLKPTQAQQIDSTTFCNTVRKKDFVLVNIVAVFLGIIL